jgi:hypothetical protein
MLKTLLLLNGLLMLAAGAVLITFPAAIPGAVGLALGPGSELLAYLLAAAELAFGGLCLGAAAIGQRRLLQAVAATIALLHVLSGIAVFAVWQGLGHPLLLMNGFFRLFMSVLLAVSVGLTINMKERVE